MVASAPEAFSYKGPSPLRGASCVFIDMNPILIKIGPLTIRYYGLMYAVAILVVCG